MDQSFLDLLRDSRSFLLTGHEHPDGDCLGSEVALYHLLCQLGKEVTICNPDPPARIYDFLAVHTPIGSYQAGEELPEHDVVILLDCAEIGRLGRMREAVQRRDAPLVVIDHHVAGDQAAGISGFVDSAAPATGAMVYDLYTHFGQPMSAAASEGVFLSLVSDTGWFRYSNTSARVLELAAELVRNGTDASRIFDALYRRNDPGSVPYLAEQLAKGQLTLSGKFGYICLDRASVERASRLGFDMDLIMEPLRSVGDIEVVALFKEAFDGCVKVSLRATRDIDVQMIASEFGGGGHRKAAGTSLPTSLQDSPQLIEDRVRAALQATSNDREVR